MQRSIWILIVHCPYNWHANEYSRKFHWIFRGKDIWDRSWACYYDMCWTEKKERIKLIRTYAVPSKWLYKCFYAYKGWSFFYIYVHIFSLNRSSQRKTTNNKWSYLRYWYYNLYIWLFHTWKPTWDNQAFNTINNRKKQNKQYEKKTHRNHCDLNWNSYENRPSIYIYVARNLDENERIKLTT